jgi:hypothetical protein
LISSFSSSYVNLIRARTALHLLKNRKKIVLNENLLNSYASENKPDMDEKIDLIHAQQRKVFKRIL